MKRQSKIRTWLKQKLKFVLYYAESFQALKTYRFNRLGLILLSLSIIPVLFSVFWVLVVFTPIKSMIPGYPDSRIRKHMINNKIRIDSLEQEIEIRDEYLLMLRNAILGIVPVDSITQMEIDIPESALSDARDLTQNAESERLRQYSPEKLESKEKSEILFMYPPVRGMVTNSFNSALQHYGTDIVPENGDMVHAALNGVIVLANYTVETGYTLVAQHDNGVITVYRHNNSLLVEAGDKIQAGQEIAVFGNTGKYSTGSHLHFEVWRHGEALDPELYINF